MRFIIDLYRYLIYFYCAGAVIATALAIFIIAYKFGTPEMTGESIAVGLGLLAFLLLNLGGVATLVSIHDRHVDASQTLLRVAAALEKMADETSANDAALR
ncbi:hypothetical protein Sphch_2577 [Sphingobium chlorophenolicum L-1]|uniref:Uncharacterized protein n=1 Tax=Sphingobium chlorophenolicum L-1 TaxID=690566 RepID=F6EZP0_SPHCR|nr:hypothetical protein [Sphingobium chlorophenolicum]AEG50224.1 hypothetical protein Sphch_2577 [Sphingobium chlorophenolicum L-1]